MIHYLIIGKSGTGKSTLARTLARRSSRIVAVLDPDESEHVKWKAEYIESDWQKYLATMKASKNVDAFIDESGTTITGREKNQYSSVQWLGTQSRKHGIKCYFIAQRSVQIPPNIRDQCGTLYLFNVSRTDSKVFAYEHGDDRLLKAIDLPPGYFYLVEPARKARLGKIDFVTGKMSLERETDQNAKRSIKEL